LTFTANASTDELTVSSTSAFVTGDALQVSTTGALPSPLVIDTTYYAIVINATTLKLAFTQADATAVTPVPIDLTTVGSGTLSIVNTTNELTLSAPTALIVGTPVILTTTGSLPTLLAEDIVFYVSSPVLNGSGLATSVKLAANLMDAEAGFYEPIVTAGTGTFSMITANGASAGSSYSIEVPRHQHDFTTDPDEWLKYTQPSGPFGAGPTTFTTPEVLSGKTEITGVEKFSLIQPATFVNVFLKL